MLGDGGLLRALWWVLAAVLAGEAVGAASALAPRLRAPAAALAAALGLVLAALASGLEPRLLAPAHWPDLANGVGRGLEALGGVTLPYAGVDPWPDITLRLGGALLVTLAAVLAAWPREEGRGFQFFALAVLLVLVATPVTAIGTSRSLVLGVALAALTVCFLWLERLPLRPGVGVAVLAGLAFAGALPLSAAADRDGPWFDYSAWAEGLGTPASVRFDWDHSYGPLRWKREGREMLRIRSARPQYWKLENLEDFDGERWVMRGVPDKFGPEPEADLDENWPASPQWTSEARVTVRGLRGDQFAGAGTTLSVDAGSRSVLPTFSPGTWQADHELASGDSYLVKFHAPRPNPLELAAASSGSRGQQADALELLLPLVRPILPDAEDTRVPARHRAHARAAAVRGQLPAGGPRRAPRHDVVGRRRAAQLALLADLEARPAPQARRPQLVRLRPPRRPLLRPRLPLRRAPGAPAGRRPAARALPVREQGRLLPALLGRDGAAAPPRRRAGTRGHRLLARRVPPPPGRVGDPRPRCPLVGRGVVRRHRLGHVRPDAERHPRPLADRHDRCAEGVWSGRSRARYGRRRPAHRPQPRGLAQRPRAAHARAAAPERSTVAAGRLRG